MMGVGVGYFLRSEHHGGGVSFEVTPEKERSKAYSVYD